MEVLGALVIAKEGVVLICSIISCRMEISSRCLLEYHPTQQSIFLTSFFYPHPLQFTQKSSSSTDQW